MLVVAVAWALGVLPAGAAAADGQTFVFTGHAETYTVPAGVHYVHIHAGGGRGGTGHSGAKGGDGIDVDARYVPVAPGGQLRVVVGGNGESAQGGGRIPYTGAGGYNGGGDGSRGAGGGGGFSGVQDPAGSYLVIAAGGGGAAADAVGGPQNPPGTLNGQNGSGSLGTPQGGGGGTLTGGGYGGHNASPLVRDGKGGQRFGGGDGGNGLLPKGSTGGAGGGGGYFGGGGGAGSESSSGGGGGAGSSYVAPDVRLVTATHTGAGQVTITPEPEGSVRSLSLQTATTMDAGASYDLTVTAVDAAGARTPDYRGTVHFSSSVPGALPQDYAFTPADGGQHVFRAAARFLKAGTLSITAADASTASISATVSGIAVRPRALHELRISPTHLIVDRPTTMRVDGFDEFGNDLGDVTTQATVRLLPEGMCTRSPAGLPICTARYVDQTADPYHVVTAVVGSVTGRAKVTVTTKAPAVATLRADPARALPGRRVTLTATVGNGMPDAPAPTGTVTFSDGATKLAGAELALRDGVPTATIETSALRGGDHELAVVYGGDAANTGTRTTLTYRVAAEPTTSLIVPTANPAPAGTTPGFHLVARTDAATPEMIGQGSFVVTADGLPSQRFTVAAADLATAASFPKPLGPGSHTIVANYLGTADFQPSQTSMIEVVLGDGRPTAVVVTSSDATPEDGEPVSLSARVTADGDRAPGGAVSFVVDGTPVGPPIAVVDGAATTPPSTVIGLGTHTVTANYLPATDLAPSSASLPGGLQVQPAATHTTLSSTPQPSDPGDPVTFTAQVATRWQPAEGRVQFAVDGQPVGDPTALSGGRAAIRLGPGFHGDLLTPGTHLVSATFQPYNERARPSAAEIRQQVGRPAATTTTVRSSDDRAEAGRPVSFTAAIATADPGDAPVGDVQFAIDGVPFGSPVDVDDGTARSPSTTRLAVGGHRITATYSGSGFAFSPSTGTLERQTVVVARADPD
jgi:hypothetical protein